MDVVKLLEAAALLVPEELATEDDMTVDDVWDHLVRDEWEVALGVLEELADVPPPPPAFWEQLAAAAEQMRLEESAAWCHWRCFETLNGVICADLSLRPAPGTGRRTAIPGHGVLRPMWDIGNLTTAGEPVLDIARLWVESTPVLEPGGRAVVRLAPLNPPRWRHLGPGQVITMYEDRDAAGSAVVLEARRPAGTPAP
ncbi:hypothetical protein OG279_33090 [Streptomyces sp. NBC_01201]|uniref:hypothetical protein n=1 Tax=unclassified Streptomyces TaxID=2593676 RepID=UPI002E109753|nr:MULTISPECIES: hypothetical protein [unclassified Streptomyces]WSQ81459.1 hypothetical protein OG725_32095 [Streptomyces sp. NBC_01213]WSQ88786.1 hypothetical protein OG722_32495 [Streptomyces sp. NBC_01212]WSR52181.1 hypothetical protein OG279_33090 [Streptomyces sp. NBC_01201]